MNQPDFDEQLSKKLGPISRDLERVIWIMGGVILVLFVGFVTLLVMVAQMTIDTGHDKQTDYQRLTDQVEAQNTVLNSLEQQFIQSKK